MGKIKIIITDIDNTLFDWVAYYANAFSAKLKKVEEVTGIPYDQLTKECKAIFADKSIEYPFVVQELSCIAEFCNQNVETMLNEVAEPSRAAFKDAAAPFLVPYKGVIYTLATLKKKYPDIPIVALTDAPRYVAMWRLNKLGLLRYFDAIFGLEDPKLPVDQYGNVKVDEKILLKHIKGSNFGFEGKIRVLPDEYEKPGIMGLQCVLMEYGIEDPKEALWIGDNVFKDIELGKKVGVTTAWAAYGSKNLTKKNLKTLSAWSPNENIVKHANVKELTEELPQPDIVLEQFEDILKHIE